MVSVKQVKLFPVPFNNLETGTILSDREQHQKYRLLIVRECINTLLIVIICIMYLSET